MTPAEWRFAMETAAKVLKRLCSEHKYIGLHEAAAALFEAEGVVRSLPMPPLPDDLESGSAVMKGAVWNVDARNSSVPPPQDKEPQE